ncbi:MAG: selenium-dependent molybdenum cofactor biosynthesis protein YqeB [Sarcina sp.]
MQRFDRKLVIVRGGGDIATGVIQKLKRAGFNVVVLESSKPSSIRRNVCLSEAIYNGEAKVEDIKAIRVNDINHVNDVLNHGDIAMLVDETGECIKYLRGIAVIDAILAKKNIGTNRAMAPITIGLGPGFEAGEDVDIVVETMRGHNLGRLIFNGFAKENTGVPGAIAGVAEDRVIYSEADGIFKGIKKIGDIVKAGEVIATVSGYDVKSKIDGVLRGLIRDDFEVTKGFKIADVDPRLAEKENCDTISDKARAVGGATLEALMIMLEKLK